MGFLRPELLLLALPAAAAWWRWRGPGRATPAVRALALVALILALAGPYLETSAPGRDVLILVDRSASMPAGSEQAALELIALAEDARDEGDRVAVIAFGRASALERLPAGSARFGGFQRALDAQGSDLGGALETALGLVPEGRDAALYLLSDGESNGADPEPFARRAAARGIPLHVRPFARPAGADFAVLDLGLPAEVAPGEPFQISAWISADAAAAATVRLERDGAVVATQALELQPGTNRVLFRDALASSGVAGYRVVVAASGDPEPRNDAAVGALRVLGPRAVLLVNHDGADDSLAHVLRAAGLAVVLRAPEGGGLDRLTLSRFRAVILENVDADRLGPPALRALADFVRERGGGLMLTGGQASFALGGYYRSAIDELLPVSMELREEWRKQGVAIAFVLDRSGSMAAPVSDALTKMDLANRGTIEALRLLTHLDSVAVIAVDSQPHLVVEMQRVTDPADLAYEVSGIRSEGGGIYVRSGLEAAARELEEAEQQNRHVVLFADAADCDEQEGVPEIVERFRAAGITLSVIALGSESDVHAEFLGRTAEDGGGDLAFTEDPNELPRLFARDALKVARSSFVEIPNDTAVSPQLLGLADSLPSSGPHLGGYNLTWLRPRCSVGLVTTDEYKAPAFAFRHLGLGRTAAFTGEIGGTYGADVVAWPHFASFFTSVARWLAGPEEPAGLYAAARREGASAVVRVELDGDATGAAAAPDTMRARLSSPAGETREVALERVAEQRWEARLPLGEQGVHLGEIALADGRVVPLAPIALPYSPELEPPSDPDRGRRLLERLARDSGGLVEPPVPDVFGGERRSRTWKSLARLCASAAVILIVVEIAGRRLQLWSLVRVPPALRARFARRAPARAAEPTPAGTPERLATARAAGAEPARPAEPSTTAAPRAKPSLGSALASARDRARRELDR